MLNPKFEAKLISDMEEIILSSWHNGCVSISSMMKELREKGWKNLGNDFKSSLENGNWLPNGVRITDTAFRYGRGDSTIKMNGTFFTIHDTDDNLN